MGEYEIRIAEWHIGCYSATITRLGCEVYEFDGPNPDDVYFKAIRWIGEELLKEKQ